MLGEKLKKLRADRGLTRECAAEKIGISTRALANYESGERVPRGEILNSIASFYGVKREELLIETLHIFDNCENEVKSEPEKYVLENNVGIRKKIPRMLIPWLIAASLIILLIIADLSFFFIENLPIDNGDSILDVAVDWRNVGLGFAAFVSIVAVAFGAVMLVKTSPKKVRALFYTAISVIAAGVVFFGVTFGILCADCFATTADERRGFATYIRLDIQGDYNGTVTAKATNNFNIGYDRVQVRLDLYYSRTYCDNCDDMQLFSSSGVDDLNIFNNIAVSADAREGYWLARAVYKTNGTGWRQIQTELLEFDDSAAKIE